MILLQNDLFDALAEWFNHLYFFYDAWMSLRLLWCYVSAVLFMEDGTCPLEKNYFWIP